jgi:DNA-binding phage protein
MLLTVADGPALLRWLDTIRRDLLVPMPIATASLQVISVSTRAGLIAIQVLPRHERDRTIALLSPSIISDAAGMLASCPVRDVLRDDDPAAFGVLRAHGTHGRLGLAQSCAARALSEFLTGTGYALAIELLARVLVGGMLPDATRALGMHRATLYRRLMEEGSPSARRITSVVLTLSCVAARAVADIPLREYATYSPVRSLPRLRRLLSRHSVSLQEARALGRSRSRTEIIAYLVALGRAQIAAARVDENCRTVWPIAQSGDRPEQFSQSV